MAHLNLQAKSVGLEYTESVPDCEISDRVRRGEVIVIPRCMQTLGYFEQLKEASLEGIRQVVGEKQAALVKEAGFEAIHTIIELDKLTSIVRCSYKIFQSLVPVLSRIVVEKVFQTKKPFYFEEEPNVRFHIPYDVAVKRKEELCKFYWNGKITAHCPHHDSWYDCPANSINIWIAIGAVKVGNGLSLYPQVYGKRLPCTEDGKILRGQYFGEALNFELEPGDVVIFHGEHLHSSEFNSTNETRHVVSLRLTLEKPKFITESSYKFIRSHSGFVGGLFDRLQAKMQSRLPKFINSFSRPQTCKQVAVFDDTSTEFPKLLQVETLDETLPDRAKLAFDSPELKVGTILPISQKLCIAKLDKHRVVVFSRYCPHEGADLAGGYLRDECVVCPWHNLPFSIESGTSPCKSLPQLTVFNFSYKETHR